MNIRTGICRKLYISTNKELTLGEIDKTLNHEWFAARAEGSTYFEDNEPHFTYPFGGTLEEVKKWIGELTESTRNFFTWVPKEFVVEHLLQTKSYPS